MIFVTVGTHEQPFDRLVKAVDDMVVQGLIREEVIIQTGYSTYEPRHCTWSKLLPYPQMVENVEKARIVITHGGPSSFLMPLQSGKIPIVMPRRKEFGEHVNDHQAEFCAAVCQRQGNIILVEDAQQLSEAIQNYDTLVAAIPADHCSNNAKFNRDFAAIVADLVSQRKS